MAAIDRDYWLDFARDGVSKSIESREKAADRLDIFLTWIWGIYTSVFALASVFNFVSSNIWQLLWIGQPILIIMLSRYFCTLVSMPSSNEDSHMGADPNEVASIIDSFRLIVDDKKRKLEIAKLATLISIISITAALIGYNYCDPNKILKQELQTLKIKKELSSHEIIKPNNQKVINDSIKELNDFYNYRIDNLVMQRKLKCLESNKLNCLDSLELQKN